MSQLQFYEMILLELKVRNSLIMVSCFEIDWSWGDVNGNVVVVVVVVVNVVVYD